jgi:hypothetical protein
MELYNSKTMDLSKNEKKRVIQEKIIRGENITPLEQVILGMRDHTVKTIGYYKCKPDHCYRAVDEKTLELYKKAGFIFDERKKEYIEGLNNQGIDWYLGGICPYNYGNIIIECPADKKYFVPAIDNGIGMSNDISIRHMKSSPTQNPIPISMISNIFDYNKIKENLQNELIQKQQELLNRAEDYQNNKSR